MTDSEELDEWSDYDSGPFCRHWSDPADCEVLCVKCWHRCPDHGFGDGAPSECNNCDCKEWVDPE